MKFQILGSVRVLEDGGELELDNQRRALLCALLVNANQLVSKSRLVRLVWPDPPERAEQTLRSHVRRLRQVLEPDGQPYTVLVTEGSSYSLRIDPKDLDAFRFEQLVKAGREAWSAGDPALAAGRFDAALGLWRGPPLTGVAELPFAIPEVERLEGLRQVALDGRIDASLALGRHRDLVPELEALVRNDPDNEYRHGQLMVALYRSGRQAEALRRYNEARSALVDELGIDPSPQLEQLHLAILNQDERQFPTQWRPPAPSPKRPPTAHPEQPLAEPPVTRPPAVRRRSGGAWRLSRAAASLLVLVVLGVSIGPAASPPIRLPVSGNPMLIQTAFGNRVDFLFASPLATGGLMICSRNDNAWDRPWKGPSVYRFQGGLVEAGAAIWSSFNTVELVLRRGDRLGFSWRDAALRLQGPFDIAIQRTPVGDAAPRPIAGIAGTPAFIQARPPQQPGDFIVVAPLAAGGLAVYRRDNTRWTMRWRGPEIVATSGRLDAVAAVEGAHPGELDVVARSEDRLMVLRRDTDGGWRRPRPLVVDQGPVTGVSGNPAVVSGPFGRSGNLEAVVPLAGGGLVHLWRDNDDPEQPWHLASRYPGPKIDAVALLADPRGAEGELEVLARIGERLVRYWRDASGWNGPAEIRCGSDRILMPNEDKVLLPGSQSR